MFERFSDDARSVVRLAQEEARRLRHPFIGTEHILLALLDEGHGPAAQSLLGQGLRATELREHIAGLVAPDGDGLDSEALATLGIDLDRVREVTEASFGPGALSPKGHRIKGHIPFSRRAKKTLELSLREALRLKHDYIGSGHILLGLLREGEGLGARVLADVGVDVPALRKDVTRRIPPQAA